MLDGYDFIRLNFVGAVSFNHSGFLDTETQLLESRLCFDDFGRYSRQYFGLHVHIKFFERSENIPAAILMTIIMCRIRNIPTGICSA